MSGRIFSDNGTTALGDVAVNLSNGAITTTNVAGDYTFTNLTAGGNYTITPHILLQIRMLENACIRIAARDKPIFLVVKKRLKIL